MQCDLDLWVSVKWIGWTFCFLWSNGHSGTSSAHLIPCWRYDCSSVNNRRTPGKEFTRRGYWNLIMGLQSFSGVYRRECIGLWHIIQEMIKIIFWNAYPFPDMYYIWKAKCNRLTIGFSYIFGFASAFGFLIQKVKIPHYRIAWRIYEIMSVNAVSV